LIRNTERVLSKYLATALLAVGAGAMLMADAAGSGRKAHREAWQRSYVSPKRPKVIKVAYETSPSYGLDHASVAFHRDRVTVTVWVHGPKHGQAVTSLVVRCASVRMGEPLRGRRRFDGKTHRHPSHHGADPLMRTFSLKHNHCPKPKVVRRHYE
jgi:hypothetical protein